MSSVIVQPGQTLADIAVEHTGSAEAVFAIAAANGLAVTDTLTPGSTVVVDADAEDVRVQRFYQQRALAPAANIEKPVRDGISVWIINESFIVQ